MCDYIDQAREPQPLRGPVKQLLLRCVDQAASDSDAKSMILTMYETGLLTPAETFAHIATRGLESA